jgi:hypothetical protein
MRLRDATPSDIEFVETHPAFPGYYVKEPMQSAYCVALEQDGNVVAVGGLLLVTKTCAWVWCEVTTFAADNKIELVRNMRNYLDMMVMDLGISRLQAWIDPEREEAIRLVQHLGFVEEYEMKNFLGVDKSAMMYIKLTEV